MRPSRNLRKANKTTSAELSASLNSYEIVLERDHVPKRLYLEVVTASELNQEDREAVWTIFEDNMRGFYADSTTGWDPTTKRDELFHPDSRFIVARQSVRVLPDGRPRPLSAYIMFRFEREEDEDVAYCYELQVNFRMKRYGIGKFLMQQLEHIATHWGMEKIMLTVLKANNPARQFYSALGFELDPTSPEYVDEEDQVDEEGAEEYDYEILSKTLPS
ncbi:acyl-CoA N-acyltransferase [Laetiporus sulphureus 93-53]|uniref:N-alpha-acetyltransferase 40 n=1 Tax=Laetiporus sulphureus 93-53 TaxID=1314785 RepID=A0A165DZ78_9APHY|nr:acyl-CoA N-acyltransferase [Laetiporus sulphureus 93-53]KZT05937.1 acyl-CoA N-acyltransferase [Laetiporus sulphureus 93-53]